MPVQQDPAKVAARWAQNLSASTQKMQDSVNALTVSPTSLAANAAQTWLARLNDPATLQKYQNHLNRVSLSDWQQAFKTKAIPRIATGAQAAIPKMTKFLQAWLPYEQTGASQVRSMPKNTLADRINRMVAMVQYNAQFPGY